MSIIELTEKRVCINNKEDEGNIPMWIVTKDTNATTTDNYSTPTGPVMQGLQ